MRVTNETREALLTSIIEKELSMFLAIQNEEEPASGRHNPDAFRLTRWMAHAVHTDAVLASYLEDLLLAEAAGRNCIAEKYGRLSGEIPSGADSPHIALIADAEAEWLEEAAARYPVAIKSTGGVLFRRYVACELEGLSGRTLALYAEEVQAAREAGRNMVEERHELLCRRMGYASLAAREAALGQE
ncbi:DUF4125 family protein [Desulfovibrio sp. TomC]|uniref:DUF4125 family protein n=1 Tax=Desulfovibrio sp. TomC TaxID=1562888 RepID=UPI00057427A4|nr:DUF4125 family protein [Desulfovibrio sp. TomC]KHK03385.1 hypothetical protein NY78_0970 [Desulfovibrio sp. TomC]